MWVGKVVGDVRKDPVVCFLGSETRTGMEEDSPRSLHDIGCCS